MRGQLRILAVVLSLFFVFGVILLANFGDESARTDELRIGTILDLTGPAASFGRMQLNGIELAIDEIENSTCSVEVRLFVEDSRLDPKLAIAAANKLISVDQVSVINSVTGSSMALVVAPVAAVNSVPILDSLSSAPALTTEGGDHYFRIQPPDSYAGIELVSWANELGAKTAVIAFADSDWGHGLRDAIRDSATELEILMAERVKPGEIDFRALIARFKNADPDLVFLVAHPQEAGLIIRQSAEQDFSSLFIGSDSLSTDEVRTAGVGRLDGVRFVMSSAGEGSALSEFQERYKSKYNDQPSANSIKPYDTTMLLHHIACTVGPDRESILEGLKSIQGYQGVSGRIAFDEDGNISSPSYDRFIYAADEYSKVSE